MYDNRENTLGRFASLLIAIVLTLAQFGQGKMVCACPTPAAPPAKQVTKQEIACPMSGKVGCRCCEANQSPSKRDHIQSDPPNKALGNQCVVSSSAPGQDDRVCGSTLTFDAPAWVESAPSFRLVCLVNSAEIEQISLVVPRIRPPTCRYHGLRAPPVCLG